DWCFRPECLERFRKHWPAAEVHRLDDCGHYVVEDAHERIVPLMRAFLDSSKMREGTGGNRGNGGNGVLQSHAILSSRIGNKDKEAKVAKSLLTNRIDTSS